MKTQLSQLLLMLLIAFCCIAAQSPPTSSFSSHSSILQKREESKIEEKIQSFFQAKIPKGSIAKRNSPPIQSEKLPVYALITAIIGAVTGVVAAILLFLLIIALFTPSTLINITLLIVFGAIFGIIAPIALLTSFVLAIISLVKQVNNPSKFKKSRKGFLVFPLLLLSLAVGLGINALLASISLPIIGLIVGIVLFAGLMYLLFGLRKADNKH